MLFGKNSSFIFFFYIGKKCKFTIIFQKKGDFLFKTERERIDASVLLSLDVKGSFLWGFEFVFFNYWKHKTKFFKGRRGQKKIPSTITAAPEGRRIKSAVARALKECAHGKKGVLVNYPENQKNCWNLFFQINTIFFENYLHEKERVKNCLFRKNHSYIFFFFNLLRLEVCFPKIV